MEFTLRSANEIIYGSGQRARTGAVAAAYGSRALLVAGRGAARRGTALSDLQTDLQSAGVAVSVFAEVDPEPTLANVEAGRQAFLSGDCDLVVAMGGGSALDTGKAIAALADLPDASDVYFSGAEIPGPGHPIIALPTTSGTGAEVTPNSVFTDPATLQKASIRGRTLMPAVAIVDPELTLSLPQAQTAFSGLDAFTQAVESYTSVGANVVSDLLAEEAAVRLAGSLRLACEQPGNLPAREELALGSLLAGLALASARLGLVHGLAHPLGALYHLPHGRVCGWLLPTVLQFNLEQARTKYAHLAGRLGLAPEAEALLAWTGELASDLGACGSWAEAGLRESDFDQIVAATVASGSSKHNPRPVKADEVRELLGRLREGR